MATMKTKRRSLFVLIGLAVLGAAAFVPVGGERVEASDASPGEAATMDLSSHSAEPPGEPIDFLFLHHSIGGQLLADPGPEEGAHSIHRTHPNGGGLRALLEGAGYRVHEASYDSVVGHRTDLADWAPKFREQMDRILRTEMQDELLPDGRRNRVVAFKSCYPNSKMVGDGTGEGDPAVPELTVANAKAALRALLPLFREHPDTLFVYFTAPPVAPGLHSDPAWKWIAKRVLGRGMTPERLRESGLRARSFNDWVKSPDGWLGGYEGNNVVVFDYYDILTGGRSGLLAYPTGNGYDSHPSAEGQRRAAEAFVPFLNRAVRRAGIAE
jgi:hypothetical protein